ncbi:hypothetical protein ACFOY8_11935 [Thalassospira xianhensis]|uniref:hypothetical protein n=1 Tax=Thalassospira xianhensis TaxID=478503 RepID=UPI0011BD56A1|nr:hypothetical protein [Thalassospira xianhensis]
MSRTNHHSLSWGKEHRFAKRKDRGYRMCNRRVGDSPKHFRHLFDERPQRAKERVLERKIVLGYIDPDDAVFVRTGGRKPHEYYW